MIKFLGVQMRDGLSTSREQPVPKREKFRAPEAYGILHVSGPITFNRGKVRSCRTNECFAIHNSERHCEGSLITRGVRGGTVQVEGDARVEHDLTYDRPAWGATKAKVVLRGVRRFK